MTASHTENPRLKILHIITHLGVGGALDNTLLTTDGLRRSGHEVHLAAGPLPSDENYTDWTGRAEQSADELIQLPDLCRAVHPIRDWRTLRALTRLIGEQQYDIVHTHCSKPGVLGRLAARRAKGPLVIHTYHSFAWQVTSDTTAAARAHPLLTNIKRRAYIALERYGAALSDGLIPLSELNREEAIRFSLAPADKFTTIHSGIVLPDRSCRPNREAVCANLNLDPERPIAAMIGRLAVQKDPVLFVRAARLALVERPDAQFIIVGDGPLASEVSEAIGSESRIRMLGYRDDVIDIMTVLNALVISSRWEGVGRALTEALAVGVPVAATAVDGVPDLVKEDLTGKLSPPGQAEPLAENIVWLLDHQAEARRMAARGRERVEREWRSDGMVQKIEALYLRLMSDRNGADARRAERDAGRIVAT